MFVHSCGFSTLDLEGRFEKVWAALSVADCKVRDVGMIGLAARLFLMLTMLTRQWRNRLSGS